MRNVTILLAVVAMLAMVVPAYGADTYGTWTWIGGTTDVSGFEQWSEGANWVYTPYGSNTGTLPPNTPPMNNTNVDSNGDTIAYPIVYISVPANTAWTVHVNTSVSGLYKLHQKHGATNGTSELVFDTGLYTFNSSHVYMGWSYNSAGTGYDLVTQNGGTVTGSWSIGDGWNNITAPPVRSDGRYVINAGTFNAGSTVLGSLSSGKPGKGLFKIAGTTPDLVQATSYEQTPLSTLEIVLTDSGEIELFNVTGNAVLSGILKVVVPAAYSGGTKTIDVMTAGGALTYTGHTKTYHDDFNGGTPQVVYPDLVLDADSIAAGYILGDNGNGTLQVTIPEPATMVLLGIGGIGMLIRRKRR